MPDITVYKSKSDLEETERLTIKSGTTGEIDRVLFPNPVQIGLNHRDFKSNLNVYGNIVSREPGEDTIRGSLTKLLDGSPYLVAGSNVTLTTGSDGQITISAAGGSGSPGGADTQVQYNNGGSFGGAADLTFNDGTGDVTIGASTGDAKLFFRDSGNYIYSNADGDFDIINSDGTASNSILVDCASGGITIDGHTGVDIDASSSGKVSIDGAGGIDIGVASDTAIDIDASTLDIDASGAVTIDTSGGSAISLDADAASNFTTSGGALTLEGKTGVLIKENGVGIISVDDDRDVDIQNTRDIDIDASGAITIDSSGGQIQIGTDDVNQNISIGTDGTRTIQLGAGDGTTTTTVNSRGGPLTLNGAGQIVDLNSAALDIDASGAITIDGSSTISIDGGGALNIDTSSGELSVGTANSGIAVNIGHGTSETTVNDNLTVSGNTTVAGSLGVNGIITGSMGLSGSLTRLANGTSYLVAGSNVTITSASNGQVTIASSGGGGGSGGGSGDYQSKTANFTAGTSEYMFGINTSSGNLTGTLPAAASAGAGKQYIFKDIGGFAGNTSKGIHIATDSNTEKIDGAASANILVNSGSITLMTDGSNWFVVGVS